MNHCRICDAPVIGTDAACWSQPFISDGIYLGRITLDLLLDECFATEYSVSEALFRLGWGHLNERALWACDNLTGEVRRR